MNKYCDDTLHANLNILSIPYFQVKDINNSLRQELLYFLCMLSIAADRYRLD